MAPAKPISMLSSASLTLYGLSAMKREACLASPTMKMNAPVRRIKLCGPRAGLRGMIQARRRVQTKRRIVAERNRVVSNGLGKL